MNYFFVFSSPSPHGVRVGNVDKEHVRLRKSLGFSSTNKNKTSIFLIIPIWSGIQASQVSPTKNITMTNKVVTSLQSCALAVPGCLRWLTFPLGQQDKLNFFTKDESWAPQILWLTSSGPPVILLYLKHSLAPLQMNQVLYSWFQKMPAHAPYF